MKRLRLALFLLLLLFIGVSGIVYKRLTRCSHGDVCGTIIVPTPSRDRAVLKWLSSAIRQYPRANTYTVVQRSWSLFEFMDGQYSETTYDRKARRIDDGSSCGCGYGYNKCSDE
jgi:hypothetical protein